MASYRDSAFGRPSTGRLVALVATTAGLAALVVGLGAGSAAAKTAGKRLTLYTAPAQQTFVDNSDDEARGDVNNPFGTKTNAVKRTEGNGPYAGDQALFSLTIYSDAKLKTKVGSVTYTCQYYFNKNAFCDASFQLSSGTLIGAGTLVASGAKFAFAITGGYGQYQGMTGDVEASPAGKQAQRLVFVVA